MEKYKILHTISQKVRSELIWYYVKVLRNKKINDSFEINKKVLKIIKELLKAIKTHFRFEIVKSSIVSQKIKWFDVTQNKLKNNDLEIKRITL